MSVLLAKNCLNTYPESYKWFERPLLPIVAGSGLPGLRDDGDHLTGSVKEHSDFGKKRYLINH